MIFMTSNISVRELELTERVAGAGALIKHAAH